MARNDGNEKFHDVIVASDKQGAIDVKIADLGDDGDEDIVVAVKGENAIVWYENDGAETFTEHTISQNQTR